MPYPCRDRPVTEAHPPAARSRLVIVDDEPDLREMVAEYLNKHGFAVRTASGGKELDACLTSEPADLLILDVNMPEEDGFSVARRVRSVSSVPILMLTAANQVVDRVAGLELGADDYLTKPFDLRELRARLRTILRRSPPVAPPHLVRFGATVLDTQARSLVREDGTDLKLTTLEFALLQAFARNPNRVLTRERLLDLAHPGDTDPFDRSIDVRVTRIRRKVELDPARPAIIRTVRGSGYMFVPHKP